MQTVLLQQLVIRLLYLFTNFIQPLRFYAHHFIGIDGIVPPENTGRMLFLLPFVWLFGQTAIKRKRRMQ